MLKPRQQYIELRSQFAGFPEQRRLSFHTEGFNHKPMLSDCGVARLLGYKTKDEYVAGVIAAR